MAKKLACQGGSPVYDGPWPRWPELTDRGQMLAALADVLDGPCWTVRAAAGTLTATERFEQAWAHRCGVPHALAVTSGSSALEVALRALGVGPGDEVVVPALGWYATAAAVLRVGATPVFA